jgi:hypothetical protein
METSHDCLDVVSCCQRLRLRPFLPTYANHNSIDSSQQIKAGKAHMAV